MALLDGVEYQTVKGSYTGFFYEDEVRVVKLLGTEIGDQHEAYQSSGRGARAASVDLWAYSVAERDAIVAADRTVVSWDAGIGEGPIDVLILSARARVGVRSGGDAYFIVAVTMREYSGASS